MTKYSIIKKMLTAGVFLCYSVPDLHAQLLNTSQMKVYPKTVMAVHSDFKNESTGELINDGDLHIFYHWTNDGKIGFTPSEQGATYFTGLGEQIIDGQMASKSTYTNFKNINFKNASTLTPFILATDINIWGVANFQNGIIDADSYAGKVIFQTNATHTNAGIKSFVDGRVQKIGNAAFEYPVGDANYYRPSFHGKSNADSDAYTTQYFYKNSDQLYPHANKEDSIMLIDDREYWEITKDKGETNIVLSLTLNKETTPQSIYDDIPESKIQIVRWDKTQGKWIVQGGETDQDQTMVTGVVSDYGIFTFARVAFNDDKEVENKEVVVYNAVSPNGDGKNDFFYIEGINNYPDNSVEIYNRWGVLVYQTNNYNETDRVFRGYSDGRATVKKGDGLPTGTYYYILKYKTDSGPKQKAGYLYLSR